MREGGGDEMRGRGEGDGGRDGEGGVEKGSG